jgi:hypothetical protein
MDKEIIIAIDSQYESLSFEDKRKIYDLYFSDKDDVEIDNLKKQLQLLIFKEPPPTGEEFLDPKNGWLPKSVIDDLYDHVKEDFLNIVDGKENYKHLCFYGGTRLGKTYFGRRADAHGRVFCAWCHT